MINITLMLNGVRTCHIVEPYSNISQNLMTVVDNQIGSNGTFVPCIVLCSRTLSNKCTTPDEPPDNIARVDVV